MIKRIFIFTLGVIIACFGLILSTRSALGMSPISSFPLVISEISKISYGYTTIAMYFVFVVSQVFICKKITLRLLLQIPFSFMFGIILNLFDSLLLIKPNSIFQAGISLFIALIVMSLGCYFMVYTNLILNPVDGIIKETSIVINKTFGQTKTYFDATLGILSIVISYIFTGKLVDAIGIGTIISIIVFGKLISFHAHNLNKYILPIVEESKKKYNF